VFSIAMGDPLSVLSARLVSRDVSDYPIADEYVNGLDVFKYEQRATWNLSYEQQPILRLLERLTG
jgi:hypothetical protein